MLIKILLISLCYNIANAIIYDAYTGKEANETEIERLAEAYILGVCTNDIEPCDESEWRRLDGSCNNLEYVSAGAYNTPQIRLLPPAYTIVNGSYEPRMTKSGNPWPYSRNVRNRLLLMGNGYNDKFTQIMCYYTEALFGDIGTIHDISNYIINTPYCCEEKGKTEYMCNPNKISDDDPVHRFDSIRCLNLTRPLTYQNMGCTSKDSVPDRVNNATVFFDLSNIYEYTRNVITTIRTYESGLLKTEIADGRIFPSDANENTTCFIQDAIETGCLRNVPNTLLGTHLITNWFWRNHNRIATKLSELNPCWDDELLFYTARDINIAMYQQIYYYEFSPEMFGEELLLNMGIISADKGFRDAYNSSVKPQMAMEYPYAYRWFHIAQDMRQKMYDKDRNFIREYPVGNFSLRGQDLAKDNNLAMATMGAFIQPTGKFDYAADPDIVNVGLGALQLSIDIPTNDLTEAKYYSLESYINYLNFCNPSKNYTCFEDFLDVMDQERVDLLKSLYENVEDVELMAGMWSEKPMEGGYAPPTVSCLLTDQLKRSMETDRHWFERPNRPHNFTEDQLLAVRNATLARLVCDVGDDITSIQAKAFLIISDENPVVSCDEIPSVDLSVWKDDSCDSCDD